MHADARDNIILLIVSSVTPEVATAAYLCMCIREKVIAQISYESHLSVSFGAIANGIIVLGISSFVFTSICPYTCAT